MRYVLLALLCLSSGCASPIHRGAMPPSAGTQLSIEHGIWRFQRAMADAEEHCARLGRRAVHLGSSGGGPFANFSRFECVAK